MLLSLMEKIRVKNLGDHRICMSAFILSILTGIKAQIKNFETVYTSSSFLKLMKSLGVNLKFKNKFIQISCDEVQLLENTTKMISKNIN